MAVPAKIGDLYFEVSADTSGARSSISGVADAASAAGQLIATAMTTAFDAVSFAAKTAIAFAVKDVIQLGAAFNIAGQQATGLFTALTGSAEEARGILREFSELSLDQPVFDTGALQKTAQLLLTYGTAKDDVLELSENINLAAIALGKGARGAEQLALAFGQIQGKGKLEGQEVRQLGEVGVNAYAVIAEAIGKTTAETIELGRQGKLLANDVIPILSDHLKETFGPVAQNLLGSFGVQVQGLKNILTGVGSALVEPFIGRTTGGVLVDFLTQVREELLGVVDVAEDGTYVLTGALAPLTEISNALAESFKLVGSEFIGFIKTASESGALDSFASGIAELIPKLVSLAMALGAGALDFFSDLATALGPLVPEVEKFAAILFNFAKDALPAVAEGFVNIVEITAPITAALLSITNAFLKFASPVLVDLLDEIAYALQLIAGNIGAVVSVVGLLTVAFVALTGASLGIPVALAAIAGGVTALTASIAAIAAPIGIALAALTTLKVLGLAFGKDGEAAAWLNADVPIWEKPYQQLGRVAFAATGGDRGAAERVAEFNAAEAAAASFNLVLLDSATNFEDAQVQAMGYAAQMGVAGSEAKHFGNLVALAWNEAETAESAARQAAMKAPLFESELPTLDDFIAGINKAADGMMRIFNDDGTFIDVPMLEEATDLLKLVDNAAKSAWESLKKMFSADSGATIDDFLRKLPDFGKDLTEALNKGGVLGDLDASGVIEDVGQTARDVILSLAKDYNLTLPQIRDLFAEHGLAGVIQALGQATGEATKEVDPLIAKYANLGFTVDQLDLAVGRLSKRRDNAIEKDIKNVTQALHEAQVAAENAKKAFDDYFKGGTGGLQGAIDDLVLDIPSIGDSIEAGLLKGGPQGEAMVRQALGQAGTSLGAIFQAGMEQGLSPEQIMAQLGPVYGSIQQELGGALNRITTLDWTEGFTPAAAAEIQSWFGKILDPSQIQGVFDALASSQGAIPGLQAQLDDLNLQKEMEVTFSKEQIQAELDAVTLDVPVIPEVSPEASAALEDAINDALNNEDFAVAIDDAQLTQDIMDAAHAAADQIQLDFNSSIIFDDASLLAIADVIGGNFAESFKQSIYNDFMARNPGVKPEGFIGPVVGEGFQGPPAPGGNVVNQNNVIQVYGQNQPIATATEVVSASSAAAGSGGKLAAATTGPKFFNPGGIIGSKQGS